MDGDDGSGPCLLARVVVKTVELVGVQPAEHAGREQALEEAADPARPRHAVSIRTRLRSPSGVTVKVVTRLESVSDSVSTRPGAGSATCIR